MLSRPHSQSNSAKLRALKKAREGDSAIGISPTIARRLEKEAKAKMKRQRQSDDMIPSALTAPKIDPFADISVETKKSKKKKKKKKQRLLVRIEDVDFGETEAQLEERERQQEAMIECV